MTEYKNKTNKRMQGYTEIHYKKGMLYMDTCRLKDASTVRVQRYNFHLKIFALKHFCLLSSSERSLKRHRFYAIWRDRYKTAIYIHNTHFYTYQNHDI